MDGRLQRLIVAIVSVCGDWRTPFSPLLSPFRAEPCAELGQLALSLLVERARQFTVGDGEKEFGEFEGLVEQIVVGDILALRSLPLARILHQQAGGGVACLDPMELILAQTENLFQLSE